MYIAPCIDKSMQIILERDSIDKPLTFNLCLLQLIFHTSVFTYYIFMHGVFNHQILLRVCTLVLFIIIIIILFEKVLFKNIFKLCYSSSITSKQYHLALSSNY